MINTIVYNMYPSQNQSYTISTYSLNYDEKIPNGLGGSDRHVSPFKFAIVI